jgi:GT2 family glycosyltransferase
LSFDQRNWQCNRRRVWSRVEPSSYVLLCIPLCQSIRFLFFRSSFLWLLTLVIPVRLIWETTRKKKKWTGITLS